MDVKEICLLTMFLINGIYDAKYKRVSLVCSLLFGGIGALIQLSSPGISLLLCLGGILLGIMMIFLSIFTKGQIGMGDGIVLSISGLYLGLWDNLSLLFGALILAGLFGTVYCLIKKCGKRKEIPFIPFLLIAYVGMVIPFL